MLILLELNKSTSDVAAEGAILNEMLEIVAKRASLRPVDAIPLQSTSQDTPNDSNVSPLHVNINLNNDDPNGFVLRNRLTINHLFVIIQFLFIYACILYYAHLQH